MIKIVNITPQSEKSVHEIKDKGVNKLTGGTKALAHANFFV